MASYWSRGLLLAELGEKPEWRRLYRNLLHHAIKHYIRCNQRLGRKPFTFSYVKRLLRAQSNAYFGVQTRKEYFDLCSELQSKYQSVEGKKFSGYDDLIQVSD